MRALITGAGGFLGGAIARHLVARGDAVRSLSRRHHPHLDTLGVSWHQGDLADLDAVQRAVAGCDVVFHVAARVGLWGPYKPFYDTNVLGTRNIVSACRQHGVTRLVFTSSPSVIYTGQDLKGVDESAPYPKRFEAHYSSTKAAAEQLVLALDGADGLRTVSLRPHLMWGPGDTNFIPRLLSRARAGSLVRLKAPHARIDCVYIEDAARAHLLAADALAERPDRVGGRAYFITSGQPVGTWDLVDRILAAAALPPIRRTVPVPLALAAASALEGVHAGLRLDGEPRMTRWIVHEMATTRWFDIRAAERDLGYAPQVTLDEGMAQVAAWLKAGGGPSALVGGLEGERR